MDLLGLSSKEVKVVPWDEGIKVYRSFNLGLFIIETHSLNMPT